MTLLPVFSPEVKLHQRKVSPKAIHYLLEKLLLRLKRLLSGKPVTKFSSIDTLDSQLSAENPFLH